MQYRSRWSWPFLIPIAVLHGCSSPADGSPFEGAGSNASSAGSTGRTSSTASNSSSAPAAPVGSTTPPAANPSLGNEQVGALPVSPAASGTGGAGAAGAGGAGGTPVVTPPAQTPEQPAPPVAAGELDPLECASYETGFLPLVHQPVCSSCHTNGGGLPRFEPFGQAQSRCAQIGREVASGDMPPNGRLSADQLAVVASWVSLGCPETAEDAAPLCAPSANPPNPANPNPPPPPAQNGGDDDDDDDGDDDDDDDNDGGDDDDDD